MIKIAIYGMGSIGKSIALALALDGCEVYIITRRGRDGFEDVRSFIKKEIDLHKVVLTEKELFKKIFYVSDITQIEHIDLVIEAIKENLAEKQALFQEIEKIFPDNVILSSVTSSLSLTEISSFMSTPERLIGLHFFNPAHLMKLVEIIPGAKTSKATVEQAISITRQIGKNPLLVSDQPGFVINRLLFTFINESINLLAEGNISAEDIDKAVKLGLNHPIGPLHLADFIGLDICLIILDNLYYRTNHIKYRPSDLLRQKVKKNELGRKSGKGFFSYS